MNIFKENNILLFEPYNGVEYIYSILQNIGLYPNFTSIESRRKGLITINELFKLDLIYFYHWGKYENELKNKELTIFEKMMYIQELWVIGSNFEDFHDMTMFKYKNWYIEGLENLGMTIYTDWKEFVKSEIGDLEKWIDDNRPKD